MQIYAGYTRGIAGHLLAVSATPSPTPGIRIAGVPPAAAEYAGRIVATAVDRLPVDTGGADVDVEPAGPDDPPLATANYARGLELPIALAVLSAYRRLPDRRLEKTVAIGGLDPYATWPAGETQCLGTRGTPAVAEEARQRTLQMIVASDDGPAAAAECMHTTAAATLEQLLEVLTGHRMPDPVLPSRAGEKRAGPRMRRLPATDLRALEIACAGWHNIHISSANNQSLARYGPIAQTLLPDLETEAARETTRIHSAAGLMPPRCARIAEPPLRIPHFSASPGAINGTGRGLPGEVNLAHNGILVVDSPAEFDRRSLEAVSAAARDGETTICRHAPIEHTIRLPARFRLIVSTRTEDLTERRRRFAAFLDLCEMQLAGGDPPDNPTSPDTFLDHRARVRCADRLLAGSPPRLTTPATDHGLTARRTRAIAQTIAALAGRREIRGEDLDEAQTLVYREPSK